MGSIRDAARAGRYAASVHSATAAATNAVALNNKVIDHAEENARAAFVAMRSAASVKSVKDLAKLQSDYVKEQGARSLAQVKEVGELIARFGKDAAAAIRPKNE